MLYSSTRSSVQASLIMFVYLVTWALSSFLAESTVVRAFRETTYGPVQGYIHKLKSGGEVERYLGVPYAAPPVGELRFERPIPPTPWTQALYTTTVSPACMQDNFDTAHIREQKPDYDGSMNEDCLYLNVYVPVSRTSEADKNKMEVLVYIHGGSNAVGMGAMFDGDVIADVGQIIVVTFNYRLGVFGFLYVPDFGINGNYGLYDQTLALTWVQENIARFGGDPSKVTIFGHSSGSADVGFHMISPKSKGLFRAAILQSGSPTAYWALIPKSKPGDRSKGPLHHLHNLGCYDRKDRHSVLNCLRQIDVPRFLHTRYHHGWGLSYFEPVVDGDFVPEHPTTMLERIQKGEKYNINCDSVVIGITNDEGSNTAEAMIKNFLVRAYSTQRQVDQGTIILIEAPPLPMFPYNSTETFQDETMNKTALESAFRPVNLDNHITLPPDDLNIWDEAKRLHMMSYNSDPTFHELAVYRYTPWRDEDNATANIIGISNMVGDYELLAPGVKLASLLASMKDTNVYFYNFNYKSSASSFPAWMGVPHGEDQFYMFGSPLTGHSGRNYTNVDRTFCMAFIKMWVQFVKYKQLVHPDHLTPLPQFKVEEENYVEISRDNEKNFFSVKSKFRKEYSRFWNYLIPAVVTEHTVQVSPKQDFIQWILLVLLACSVLICVVLALLLKKATKKPLKRRVSYEESGNILG